MGCHARDHCTKCHYKDEQPAPAAFDHKTITGQAMDKDHVKLACSQCHVSLKLQVQPACGDASCHKPTEMVAYPAKRPGMFTPVVKLAATRPVVRPIAIPTTRGSTTRPATMPSANLR
jgi:hypothetical protein